MKRIILTQSILVSFALFGCGGSTDAPVSSTPCSPTRPVVMVTDLNYPQQDCAQAASSVEGQLESLRYRKACQAAEPGTALPSGVTRARVTDCRTVDSGSSDSGSSDSGSSDSGSSDARGVFVDVEVCCAEAVHRTLPPESVVRAEGPKCPDWRTRTRASGLHYPDAESCDSILSKAEAELGSMHYRGACNAATPRTTRPARVLEARVVECRSGGTSTGVSIDVELCCEAKVFEEGDFRELVLRRPPEEVWAALGEPQRITEQAQDVYWNYPVEVARGERVFPEVTLVFAEGRVNSYYLVIHFTLVMNQAILGLALLAAKTESVERRFSKTSGGVH